MKLQVFDIIDGITRLGPGIRLGIWTQGCLRKCAGCMTPEGQPLSGGYPVDVDDLADRIRRSGRTEITVSGGEPFLQAHALAELTEKLRESMDLGLIVYTGYTYEEILSGGDEAQRRFLHQCDMIIDGAYEESLNDGKNLRGSSNQRAILITDRYKDFAEEIGTRPAEIEFFVRENRVSMGGVPSRGILEKIKHTSF